MGDKPWFRRLAGFSFVPVSWQGWVATGVALALIVPLALLSLLLAPHYPDISRLCGMAFVLLAFGFFALAFWNIEQNYDR